MILYKKEEVLLRDNTILLRTEEEESEYIYVDLHTYNQCILLQDRFEGEKALIEKQLDTRKMHQEEVEFFYSRAPEPLNIVAPFLGLVDERVALQLDLQFLCGVLHQMSQAISFDGFIKAPFEVRNNIVFGKMEILGYQKSWETIELNRRVLLIGEDYVREIANLIESIPKEMCNQFVHVLSQTPTSEKKVEFTDRNTIENFYEEEEEEEEIEDIWSLLSKEMKEAEKQQEAEKEEKETKEKKVEESPIPQKEEIKEEESTMQKLARMYGKKEGEN